MEEISQSGAFIMIMVDRSNLFVMLYEQTEAATACVLQDKVFLIVLQSSQILVL